MTKKSGEIQVKVVKQSRRSFITRETLVALVELWGKDLGQNEKKMWAQWTWDVLLERKSAHKSSNLFTPVCKN